MQRVSNLTATVISMHDENGHLRVWRSVGIEELWARARYTSEAEIARARALDLEEQQLFQLRHPENETEYLSGLCLPIRTRDRVFGVLEAYGPASLAESETTEVLGSLTSQAASALQNARLYAELGEREHRLQDLVGKLLGAQEEERRRVAYEVHDGLAQVAAAAHQHLQAFARRYSPEAEKGRKDLDRILRLVRATVSDARRIIANLRPTALDDLGLVATITLEVERLREEGYYVDYEEEIGETRLPDTIEITLYRIVQESLTNMRKHAEARRVRIGLRLLSDEVRLEVQDNGSGFDASAASASSGPGERIGLVGMRERAGLLNGTLKIKSQPGSGTLVEATIPLMRVP
jgi:signal transduction histidine kinase